MADIVNLRRARKARARAGAAAAADARRILHGTPPALRELARARLELVARQLDGTRRDPGLVTNPDPEAAPGPDPVKS